MGKKILLTSFDTWKAHQPSNSSDDLFTEILKTKLLNENVLNKDIHLVRKLPVDFQLAPQQVISEINQLQPDVVICCGMAEKRIPLTIESNGKRQAETLTTAIDLELLLRNSIMTEVSHDAGNFVCNHLYYSVLKYIQDQQLPIDCIFIHVPILNGENLRAIVNDFLSILQAIQLA